MQSSESKSNPSSRQEQDAFSEAPVSGKGNGMMRLLAAKVQGPSARSGAPRLDRPVDQKPMESLEQRRLMSASQLPVSLDFTASVNGTLLDTDGQGTGFTVVQQNANGNAHDANLLDLDTDAGLLKVTTSGSSTTGSNVRADDSLRNALAVQFDATRDFDITTRIVGNNGGTLSQLNERYEQAGIMLGADSDHFVKLVALYH